MRARPKIHGVAVEVTAHCNQKCDYCYNAWRADNGAGIDGVTTDVLRARLSKLFAAVDVDHVTVTGGEPLARKDIFAILDHVRRAGVGVQMISNGGLVTDVVAGKLAAARLRAIQITLNGPDARLHEDHVGEGHFDATVRGIDALVRRGVRVVGCVVVTRKNASHVGAILERFYGLGVRQIALSRFSPAGYAAAQTAALLPSRPDLLVAFRQALPFATARGMQIACTMPVPPCAVETEELAPIRFGVCPIGTDMQELALGPDGRLRNCTLHARGLGDSDILDPSVDVAALLASTERSGYRRVLPSFCEGCAHASTCGGGCGAAAEWVLGGRGKPDPVVWQHVDPEFRGQLAAQRAEGESKRRLSVLA